MNTIDEVIPSAYFKLILPHYRKRKIKLFRFDSQGLRKINTASYWDGGSRRLFIVFNLETGKITRPPAGEYPSFNAQYELQPREILIEYGTFCGKESIAYLKYYPHDSALVAKFFVH